MKTCQDRPSSVPARGTNHFKYIQRHFANGRRSLLAFSKYCSKCWPGRRSLGRKLKLSDNSLRSSVPSSRGRYSRPLRPARYAHSKPGPAKGGLAGPGLGDGFATRGIKSQLMRRSWLWLQRALHTRVDGIER